MPAALIDIVSGRIPEAYMDCHQVNSDIVVCIQKSAGGMERDGVLLIKRENGIISYEILRGNESSIAGDLQVETIAEFISSLTPGATTGGKRRTKRRTTAAAAHRKQRKTKRRL